jgi:hypothetical protein
MNIEDKSFKELLRASMKSKDTEEWIDVYFTRPIGLVFAKMWYRLGVTPNTITILSIFLGVAAGAMFYFTNVWYNIIGVVLLVLANLCDSTDGQLARLTNQRSMIGRCLDGFAGDTWFFAIYLAIALRIWHQHMPGTNEPWGFFGLALAAIAGIVCHAQQSSLADYYRQIHLYFLKGKAGSELDAYASEHAIVEQLKGKKGVFWDRAFHYNYQNYCKSQERRTPEFQKLRKALKERYGTVEKIPQEWKENFLKKSRPLMPITNFLTFNSRAIIIYITVLANIPWLYFFIEIIGYTMVYMFMHKRHEDHCRKMRKELDKKQVELTE